MKLNKTSVIAITSVATLLFGGLIIGSVSKAYAATPITLNFMCCSEEYYDDIALDVCPCTTGLEAKELLASAINDGVMPTEIFLLYESDEDVIDGQIYDDDTIGDYLNDGDKVYYMISPVPDGEIYGDTGYHFECNGYDQYSGKFYYTLK
ncbi:hypothetical protein IJI91_02035 [Candidatus Saccharibacteria bacterium]|nr:hypothetical protein [Candidatus Saccharibacteria bacterium]